MRLTRSMMMINSGIAVGEEERGAVQQIWALPYFLCVTKDWRLLYVVFNLSF